MSVELWLGVGHYLLGVLVIFALVVALMETSRKFDRFHDNSYLLLATGYFFLVVWALIRAIAIGPSILQTGAIACLLAGLFCLAFGYYFHHQAHPDDGEGDHQAVALTKKLPKANFKEDWMKMLSATTAPEPEEETAEEPEAELASTEEEKVEEPPAEPQPQPQAVTEEPPQVKEVKPKKVRGPVAEVDLSYLASRTKKNKEIKPVPPTPAPTPVPEIAQEPTPKRIPAPAPVPAKVPKSEPVTQLKTTKKPIAKKEKIVTEPVKETRDEIMDDLFPLAHKTKKNKISAQADTDILPGEGLHDAK